MSALTEEGQRLAARQERARANMRARPGLQLDLFGLDVRLAAQLASARLPPDENLRVASVYAVQAGDGPVKIGYTSGRQGNLRWRMRDIRNKSVRFYGWQFDDFVLRGLWAGDAVFERALHRALRAHQLVPDDLPYPTEWFGVAVLSLLGLGTDGPVQSFPPSLPESPLFAGDSGL